MRDDVSKEEVEEGREEEEEEEGGRKEEELGIFVYSFVSLCICSY